MDRWLGDGGMPIIGVVGGAFTGYGVDGEDLGWVTGTFTPTDLACNPHGVTQAGIHSLLLDAAMNFAINAALPGKARTRGTLEMKTECMRPALKGDRFELRGEVVRMAKQVAYGGGHGARRRRRAGQPGYGDLSPASPRPRPRLTPSTCPRQGPGCAASAVGPRVAPPPPCASPAARWAGGSASRSPRSSRCGCARCRAPSTPS